MRAFATNSAGTGYGNQITFTTTSSGSVPTLTTTAASAIATTSATSGGIISSDGGVSVTARGVCWSTSQNPTTSNSKTTDGTGTGSFTSSITGLTAGTTYYVRAYATNSAGTAYGSQVSFATTNSIVYGSVSDVDGNTYSTVTIGTQVWMAENLKTTKYNDNSVIPLVTNDAAWSDLYSKNTGYCWYNNDAATYKGTYGALYNWYTVDTGKLCPIGWHVPSDTEWTTLANYLGQSVAGSKLKEAGTSHWASPNSGATNETGFTGLPGGMRTDGGTFAEIGIQGYFWTSNGDTGYGVVTAWAWILGSGSGAGHTNNRKVYGWSVRCLKN